MIHGIPRPKSWGRVTSLSKADILFNPDGRVQFRDGFPKIIARYLLIPEKEEFLRKYTELRVIKGMWQQAIWSTSTIRSLFGKTSETIEREREMNELEKWFETKGWHYNEVGASCDKYGLFDMTKKGWHTYNEAYYRDPICDEDWK